MKIKSFFMSIVMLFLFYTSANAQDLRGLAVYRDGVLLGEWHAALIYSPNLYAYSQPIIHIGGSGESVKFTTYSEFLNGNAYQGVFSPTGGELPDYLMHDVLELATELTTESIGYTPYRQLEYDKSTVRNNKIQPKDIIAMRCDGVVEYCYEYFGFKVQSVTPPGYNYSFWDVSTPGECEYHQGALVTPRLQAKKLIKVN